MQLQVGMGAVGLPMGLGPTAISMVAVMVMAALLHGCHGCHGAEMDATLVPTMHRHEVLMKVL